MSRIDKACAGAAFVLALSAAAPAWADEPRSTAGDDEWYDLPPLAWVGFSVGTAFLATGTVTGIVTIERARTLEERCGNACPQALIEQDLPRANLATASFVIAGVAIAGGVAAILFEPPRESGELRPMVGPGVAGLEGSF